MRGRIVSLVSSRGYGFIEPEDRGTHVFLHATALANRTITSVELGDLVEFEVHTTAKGPRAENVTVI